MFPRILLPLFIMVALAAVPVLHASPQAEAAASYQSCLTGSWNQIIGNIANMGDKIKTGRNISTEEAILVSRLGTGGYTALARKVTKLCGNAFYKNRKISLPLPEKKKITAKFNPILYSEAREMDAALMQACTEVRKRDASIKLSSPAARSKILSRCAEIKKSMK